MSQSSAMRLNDPDAYRIDQELEVIRALADPAGCRVLELGCGAGWMARQLRDTLGAAQVVATEVDQIQHARNLQSATAAEIDFRYGGAESIADADDSYDRVFMLKSLHHVPFDLMDQALVEVHRVLRPGGLLYVSEPVYWGPFNALMRLIADEREVREAAFAALCRAVDGGRFKLETEVFYEAEGCYPSWDAFAARFLQVTHSERDLSAAQVAAIRAAFTQHLGPDGACFRKPHRVDLLRKPAA